jgi:hypothetical protein
MVVVAMVVAAEVAVMKADKKVVEVVMTTTTIAAAIEIRRSTRILLVISITVFPLVMFVVTSLVMLTIARPMGMCATSSMTPNTPPRP